MIQFHRLRTLIFILLALALVSCTAMPSEDAPAGPEAAQAEPATSSPDVPTAASVEDPAPTAQPTATAQPEPTKVALGPPPAFSAELRATDPQTVALGAGRPQLVELFAFW